MYESQVGIQLPSIVIPGRGEQVLKTIEHSSKHWEDPESPGSHGDPPRTSSTQIRLVIDMCLIQQLVMLQMEAGPQLSLHP
jgi:hypothetical protein